MSNRDKISLPKIKWLISELPKLKAAGIIEENVDKSIVDYYRSQLESANAKSILIAIFNIAASLLT